MPWARLDDRFWSHPKVAAAGLEAVGLHARALSYVAGHGTAGRLPRDIVKMLAGSRWRILTTRCVTAGLWDIDGDDWAIHDWGDPMYGNPTAGQTQARSEAGRKAAAARWGNAPPGAGTHAGRNAKRMPDADPPDTNRNAESMRSDASRAQTPASQSQSQSQVVSGSLRDGPQLADAHEQPDHHETEQQEQLAITVHTLQPAWQLSKIREAITGARRRASIHRVTTALLIVAIAHDSQSPRRVLSDGYWWDEHDTRHTEALLSPRLTEVFEAAS